MCEWNAAELLSTWRTRSAPDLERLGAGQVRATEDGSKATIEIENDSFIATVMARSYAGMLELISVAGDVADTDPDVFTEQREARSDADILLDAWLVRLRELSARSA